MHSSFLTPLVSFELVHKEQRPESIVNLPFCLRPKDVVRRSVPVFPEFLGMLPNTLRFARQPDRGGT